MSIFEVLLAGLIAAQSLLCVLAYQRIRNSLRRSRQADLALALHLIGEPIRRDAAFTAILEQYQREPSLLSRADRVRARSWYKSASRIFGEALAQSSRGCLAAWAVPAMGENSRLPDLGELRTLQGVIELDPEFIAFLDALREGKSSRSDR